MSNFIGEIRMLASASVPFGWLACDGAVYAISSYPDLGAMLGNTYGGDGVTTFGVPDLRGKFALGRGLGYALGASGGESEVVLTTAQIPEHSHGVRCNNGSVVGARPAGRVPGKTTSNSYDEPDASSLMDESMIVPVGGGVPHNNMPPYVSVGYVIATNGDSV